MTKPVGCLLLNDWVGWIDYVCSPTIRRMDEGTHLLSIVVLVQKKRADSLIVVLIRFVAHASNGLPQLFSLELIIVAISLSSSSIGSPAPPLLFAAIRMIISMH